MKSAMRRLLVLPAIYLGLVPWAFAGKSLVLTPGVTLNSLNNPTTAQAQSWRVEFQLHDWAPPTIDTIDGYVWGMNGLGANATISRDGRLRLNDVQDNVGGSCTLNLGSLRNVLVRVQRDAVNMRFVCELWNYDGTGYQQSSLQIKAFLPRIYSGGGFGSAYTTCRLGFFRIFNTIIPDGQQPPVTAGVGNVLNLNFDGNANDTSTGSLRSSGASGGTYASTPIVGPSALIQTGNAPSWSNWVSLRAGYPAILDGSKSFSLADGSSAVQYQWQQVSGPTVVRWRQRNLARVAIDGLVFGSYTFRLKVTDTNGLATTTDLQIGAVATDDNGVVIHSNPEADILFGPMIAFGKNPWAFQDQMTLHAAIVRAPQLDAVSPPSWTVNLAGTITYEPANFSQAAQTTLAAALSPGDMNISLANALKLDFSSLPTIVMMVGSAGYFEEIRVCSVSGNTLSVCYDGRAWHAGQYQEVPSPQAWTTGTRVFQAKTKGINTHFTADFCPAGPGEEGQIKYAAGTVGVLAGSTTLTGQATAWDGTLESLRVRIEGTHSGTPFVFFSTAAQINGATSITLARPWPTDADTAGGLNYSLLKPSRTMIRHWVRPDGTPGQQSESVSSCESDTSVYHSNVLVAILGVQTNQYYSFWDGFWFSDFGPNYYDEILANYAGYFRSGYQLFLDNARKIGDYWSKSPDFDEGWVGVSPRRVGATGIAARAVLDGKSADLYTLKRLAKKAAGDTYVTNSNKTPVNCDGDLRESAYELSWIALAALFDPDSASKASWQSLLDTTYARDNGCKGPDNNFPTIYTSAGGAYSLTNGSAIVKGSNIPASMCPIAATGTITVIAGSTQAEGTGFVQSSKIAIPGFMNGNQYLFRSMFTLVSSTSIALSAPYDGDSGTYTYQIEPDLASLSFNKAAEQATNIDKFHTDSNYYFSCVWNNPGQITLDHAWPGLGGTYGVQRYSEIGYGTQPFFVGIKTLAMRLASLAANEPTAGNYTTLANAAAQWVLSNGFDPISGGLHYATGWGICNPDNHPRIACTYDASVAGQQAARTLNGEAQNAMGIAYKANPTARNLSFGDQFYARQWGKLGGPASDGTYLNALDNDNLWSYKYLGFLFGIGMSHQWPAVRIGGVQPSAPGKASIDFNLAGHGAATSARIRIVQPSGAILTVDCTSSPCQFSVDRRQGAHWYTIEFLSSTGAVIDRTDGELLKLD